MTPISNVKDGSRVFVGEDYVCMMDDVFETAVAIVECGLDGAEMG